jgi:diguanylate cyclase (GGDEF)-like protein
LESSQLQLSSIYETTRALSGILDLEHLLGEILQVAQNVFRFQKCSIYLYNAARDCLYLHAALKSGDRHIYRTPPPYSGDINGLVEPDDQSRILGHPGRGKRNSGSNELDFPLISRGKPQGIMQVTAESGNLRSGRDRRLLLIFASAVAVAIDNSLLHKKTEELTIIDALTEIYNYRYFREKLLGELRRADRYRHKLSVLMLDLDHFKEINDQHGHQTGNIILREVSNIMKECIRDIDIVARYGGEEFVVILPQTDEEDARIIAERIRETVERCFFPNSRSQREVRLTVSLGVATYPEGVHTIEQLLEKVDKALYRAKTEGRNRVFIAEKPRRRTAEFSQ